MLQKNIHAHHKIYSPRVKEGRQSFEWRGHFNFDDRDTHNKQHHHVLETEYSWTDFWQSELELHISDKKNTPLDWEKQSSKIKFKFLIKIILLVPFISRLISFHLKIRVMR